jgi:flagellum-specific ATP synthase
MIKNLISQLENLNNYYYFGEIEEVKGYTIKVNSYLGEIGSLCWSEEKEIFEVVGFEEKYTYLMPLKKISGIKPKQKIFSTGEKFEVEIGSEMVGRVLNCLGFPIDSKPNLFRIEERRSIFNNPPNPMTRERIKEILPTGIKVIDALFTIGKGQRIGIFSGSGVGKSALLGMLARNNFGDVNVVCLVGERGREVREFIEEFLGKEGLRRSVVVVSTSDESPLSRIRCVYTSITIAEFFRDKNLDVTFFLDSLTRFAMAQRELGLSIGEPPTSKGYPPSIFGMLSHLLERCGTSSKGSITGFFTILVEGDDLNEPISDYTRSIIDGHICLDRDLFNSGQRPAVDILKSLSRLMYFIVDKEHMEIAEKVRKIFSIYNDVKDIVRIGAYKKGTDKEIDYALEKVPLLLEFFTQDLRCQKMEINDIICKIKEILNG